MERKGFLMVTMEPPPAMEEEFNDWYDTEHIPEREAVDGFETSRRYVCLSGFPRYMAAYDLTSPGVLTDGPYQRIAGDRYSPWTRRILNKARGLWRVTGEQIHPGQAQVTQAPRLLLLHYCGIPERSEARFVDAIRATYEVHDQVIQVRIIRDEPRSGGTPDHVVLIEGRGDLGALRGPATEGEHGGRLVLANEYARYWAYSSNSELGKVVAG